MAKDNPFDFDKRDDSKERPSPRSQSPARRSRGMPVWVWILVAGIGVNFLICCGAFLVGFVNAFNEGKERAQKEKEDAKIHIQAQETAKKEMKQRELQQELQRKGREFVDHPEQFRGRTVKMRLMIEGPLAADESLQQFAGRDVKFKPLGDNDSPFGPSITIQVPGNVPDAHVFDDVIVTVTCREGQLTKGNVATRIDLGRR
jgi:hypothetical protein